MSDNGKMRVGVRVTCGDIIGDETTPGMSDRLGVFWCIDIDSYLASGKEACSGQAAGDPLQRQVRHLLEGYVVRQHVPRDVADLLQRPHPRGLVEDVSHGLKEPGLGQDRLPVQDSGEVGSRSLRRLRRWVGVGGAILFSRLLSYYLILGLVRCACSGRESQTGFHSRTQNVERNQATTSVKATPRPPHLHAVKQVHAGVDYVVEEVGIHQQDLRRRRRRVADEGAEVKICPFLTNFLVATRETNPHHQ